MASSQYGGEIATLQVLENSQISHTRETYGAY